MRCGSAAERHSPSSYRSNGCSATPAPDMSWHPPPTRSTTSTAGPSPAYPCSADHGSGRPRAVRSISPADVRHRSPRIDTQNVFLCRHVVALLCQAAHRVERGLNRLEVVAGHGVGVLLLAGRPSLDAADDEGEAEPQAQVVLVAFDLVGDGAQHGAGDAGEHDPVRRLQRDALGEALPPEVDVAVEDRVVVARDDLAEGHARHERQRVVGLEHESFPDGGAVESRFAGSVDRQLVRYVDHDVLPEGSMTGFRRVPRPSMVVRTTSPSTRYSPRPAPTPDGVPVEMTSPGSSVTSALAAEMSSATVQIMSEVDSSCWSSSFTHRRTRRFCGSGIWNAGVIPGPNGSEPSMDLAANQS